MQGLKMSDSSPGTPKIRLLQVIPRHPHGGIYRVNLDLLEAFINDNRIELHVALIKAKDYQGEFGFRGLQPTYSIISGTDLQKSFQLAKLARRFDIVHLHGFAPWMAAALLKSPTKLVYTNHGLLGVGRKLKTYELLKKNLMKQFLQKRVDHIVNISNYAKQRVIREYMVEPNKNSVVHNCTRWQKKTPAFQPNGNLSIGFHGRFVHFKRVDRLINVASMVNQQIPVTVKLLGDGPLKSHYIHLAQRSNLNIHFNEYTLEPQSVIETFDVEILASDEEYFGLSVIESILAGNLTMVFSDGGGCTEIFGDQFPDFIAKDEVDMAYKIISFYKQKDKSNIIHKLRMLQNHVETNFSLEKFKTGYLETYLNIISENNI